MEYLIAFGIGALIGFVLCKMFFSTSQEAKIFPSSDESIALRAKESEITVLKIDKARLEEQLNSHKDQLGVKQSKVEELVSRLQQNQIVGDELKQFLSKEFEGLANKALKENAEELSKSSKSSIETLLNPVKDRLKEFQEKVENFNANGIKHSSELRSQLETLEKNNVRIIGETEALTNAFRTNQNVKGTYGESLLATLLQSVGLMEGKQYNHHPSTEVGFPDFIVNLPDRRGIIIDSKNVLESYIEFTNEDNKEQKEKKSKAFKAAVKKRIKELDDKHYKETELTHSPDFILMFIPIESSLGILYDDIGLINEALAKNVIIVGSSSLLTTLRLINYLWKQNDQEANAKEIARAGAELYDKFVEFTKNLEELQSSFNKISGLFTTTINKFSYGKGSLFNKVEDLKILGVNPTKQISQKFLETDSDLTEAII